VSLVGAIGCSSANSRPPEENPLLADLIDYRTGLALLRDGRADEAILVLRRASASSPRDPNVPNALGLALLYKKDLVNAEKAFTQALKLDPAFVQAQNNRGVCRMESARYDEAEADFGAVVQGVSTAERANAHFNLGMLAERREKWGDAEREFSLVLSADPRYSKAFRQRGIARLRRDDFRGALEDLLTYLKEEPNDTTGNYNAALCLLTTGRRDVAMRYMERVLAAAPESDEGRKARRFLENEDPLVGKQP
jgi:Flp pilus assembly protein TadD